MGDQAERVVLEAEDQVSPVVDKANTSLDGFEKKATAAHDKVVRITDQTRTSVQRLVASLEKQAETFGKTGVDRLVSQRDQLLQRYAKEPQAIDAITRSYEKMIAVEEKASRESATAKAAKDAEEALQKQSKSIESFGDRIGQFIQNPIEGAKGAVGGLVSSIGTIGTAVAAGAAVLVGFGLAAFDAAKALGEYGLQTQNVALRTGLATKEVGQFTFAARMAGQDATIYERMMRGLSQAADENSKEGEKARGTLQRLGVDLRGVTGDLKPTSQILTEISTALGKLPDGMERDAAAMGLFKRAGIEAIPVITGLTDNIKRAKEMGLGATDEDLKRWEEYHRNVTEAEVLWERFTRKIKEPLAAVITFLFKDNGGHEYSLEELAKRGVNLGKWAPRTQYEDDQAAKAAGFGNPAKEEWERNITRDDLLSYTGHIEDRKRADAAVRAMDAGTGMEGQLKEAEAALQKLTRPEVGKVKSVDEVNEYTAAEKHVESLKKAIEATKELTSARRAAARAADELWEHANKKMIEGAEELAWQNSGGIHLLPSDIQAGLAANEANAAPMLNAAMNLTATRQMMARKSPDAQAQDLADSWANQKKEDEQHLAAVNREVGMQEKLLKLNYDGADLIERTYKLRLAYAEQEYDVNLKYMDHETATVKFVEEADKARITRAEALAELQKKQADDQTKLLADQEKSISHIADKLIDTLITKPKAFGKDLAKTVREAMVKPVIEMGANVLQPAIYGDDGKGGLAGIFKGIFGGGKPADPVKVSTDQNTAATIQNSVHVAALTAVLAGAMGVSAPAIAAPAIPGISLPSISAPAVSIPTRIAAPAMPGASLSAPPVSIPARFAAPFMGSGGGAVATLTAAAGPSFSDLANLPMNQDRIAQTFAMGGPAPSAPYSAAGLANLPMNRQNPLFQMMGLGLGGGKQAGGAGGGIFSNLKGAAWNQSAYESLGKPYTTGASLESGGLAVGTSPAATAAGMMMATSGLMGSHMGSWAGVGMGAAGGGLVGAGIGMQSGGPMGALLGAGIGAVAGLGIGLGEKLAGIESPQVKAHNDIKQIYGVDIPQNSGTIKQVVSIAQSQFGGDIAVAVRSPNVRQLVMLYSEATGQKMPLSASTPYAGSLVEQGGNLYQQASFQNNAWHTYASDLPTLGGIGGTTFPTTPGPNATAGSGTYVSLNINGQPITADFVADQTLAAQNASYGRTQQSANLQVPGLMVA